MSAYFNANNISTLSFLVLTTQLSYSITNGILDMNSLIVLAISGGFVFLYERTVENTKEAEYKLRIDEFEKHQTSIKQILKETTKIHDDISSKYSAIASHRIDDDEVECEHVFKKVVIGYDDMVKRCIKCEHEIPC